MPRVRWTYVPMTVPRTCFLMIPAVGLAGGDGRVAHRKPVAKKRGSANKSEAQRSHLDPN